MPKWTSRTTERPGKGSDELTASALIDLRSGMDVKYLRSVRSISVSNGAKPWKWYDSIGEVHYAVSRGARVAGYANLQARQILPDGSWGKVLTSGQAAKVVQGIHSPYGGRRALIERFFTMMKVPGDAYLIRCRDENGNPDGYDFISADEIEMESLEGFATADTNRPLPAGAVLRRITLPAGKSLRGFTTEALAHDIQPEDFIGRVWRPANRYVDMADSPMRSSEDNCEMLHLLTVGLKAKMLSRLSMNGIIYVPSEINDIRSGTPKSDGEAVADNRVLDRLIRASQYMIQNFDDPAAALPIFMSGPGQYADMIKHIVYDRQIYETDMKLRAELIDRILMGLDVQPTDVKGMGDSNHWSAWAVSDDERRVNIQPDMETMCWALTRMILHAELQAAGVSPGRIRNVGVWYDLSKANVKTNLAEDARQASDRITISPSAVRRYTGFDESDAPSELEFIRELGRIMKDPYLATFEMSIAERIDWEKVAVQPANGPDAATEADPPKAGPGKESGSPDSNDSDTPRRLRPA